MEIDKKTFKQKFEDKNLEKNKKLQKIYKPIETYDNKNNTYILEFEMNEYLESENNL